MVRAVEDGAAAAAVLSWLLQAGVDTLTGDGGASWLDAAGPPQAAPAARAGGRLAAAPADAAADALSADAPPASLAPASPAAPPAAPGSAAAIAAACRTLEELEAAIEAHEGCSLRSGATCTVFADGNPASRLMVIGEAPGAEEDRAGKPFVGPAGRLLDRMLGAIGLDRQSAYISNVVYWRPPADRTPSDQDVSACMPFVRRQIELVRPRAILALGATAAKSLLGRPEGITRLRGRWHDFETAGRPVRLLATFHPAYLLRQPGHKRLAWADLLAFRKGIDADG